MSFRTTFKVPQSARNIDLNANILAVGSCFAQHIGQKLLNNKFGISTFQDSPSPFVTIFNPISIFQSVAGLFSADWPDSQHLIETPTGWKHLDFHSQLAGNSPNALQVKLSELKASLQPWAQQPEVLLITFGTAWVYEWKQSQQIVANCHKVPNKEFEKRLLSVDEILQGFEEMQKLLGKETQIILTVSPVRHIKDTLPLNAVSKSVLRLACHQLAEQYEQAEYFPAYEILLDDLRDYRFYKSDMLHPSEQAVDYIWQKFAETYFSASTTQFLQKWQKIQSKLTHKAFAPQSEAHQKFLRNLLVELEGLSGLVMVEREIELVRSQLVTM